MKSIKYEIFQEMRPLMRLDETHGRQFVHRNSNSRTFDSMTGINGIQEIHTFYGKLILDTDTTRNPSSDGTSNPKPKETLSDFKVGSCGEPLFAQHVVIDFTPNEDDNDLLQKKVCSFWQFIKNNPGIQNQKVKPEKNLFTGDSITEIASDSIKSGIVTDVAKVADKQAIQILEFAEEKNLIDTVFEAKLPQTMCSVGSREYTESEVSTQPQKKKKKHICKRTPCSNPRCRNKKVSMVSSDELSPARILSKKMNEWDAQHPKSMKPPGHAPPLHQCIIQRQMFQGPL